MKPTPRTTGWDALGPTELANHVQRVHHDHLADELPRLRALAVKVYTAHRECHPELDDVVDAFDALHDELVRHLAKEDAVLFPLIRDLSTVPGIATDYGGMTGPIQVMLDEHAASDQLLDRLRAATNDYEVPADACTDFRALYDGLRALDEDARLHLHKESAVLFPAVLALARAEAQGPGNVGEHR